MKITLVTAGTLALAMVAPLSVSAQQAAPPPYQTQGHMRVTPDEPTMQHRWQKRLGVLNLSRDQQQRISSIVHGFAQTHPAGSPQDRAGSKALRQQIMAVLSPAQVQQYREMMHQRHEQNGQARPDAQGQPDSQYGDPRDQQQQEGPPPNYQGPQDQGQGPSPDYQGGPQDQGQGPPGNYPGPPDQGQGPPPDQGQGPPPDQGQGPPPDQGQGPPPDQGQGPPPAA
jgi:Spy/CpxP family protein refolding chaperone